MDPLICCCFFFFSLLDLGYEQFKIAEKSHSNWIKLYLEGNNSEILLNLGKKVLKQYLEALRTLSSSLSKQVAQYDMYSMMVGTVIVMEVKKNTSFYGKSYIQNIKDPVIWLSSVYSSELSILGFAVCTWKMNMVLFLNYYPVKWFKRTFDISCLCLGVTW